MNFSRRHGILSTLFFAGLSTLVSSAQMAESTASTPPTPAKTINIRDCGARGDGITDDAPAIARAIAKAKALGRGAAVYVPAGSYLLASKTVDIDGATDLTLYGDGEFSSLLAKNPDAHVVNITGSRNVTVSKLTLDRVAFYFSQGWIDAENKADKSIDIHTESTYPDPDAPSVATATDLRVFTNPDSGGYSDVYGISQTKPREKLDDHRFRIYMDGDIGDNLQGKKYILWRDRFGGHGVNISDSSDCLVQDVTYYGRGSNAGLLLGNTTGTMTFRRFVIKAPPGSNGLISCSGGGMQIDVRGKLDYEDCDFEGIDDDGADVTTHYSRILAHPLPNQLIVQENTNFHSGDRVAVVNWMTKCETMMVKLLDFRQAPDGKHWMLTFDRPVTVGTMGPGPDHASGEQSMADGIDRVTDYENATTSTIFHNCKFQCLRARPLNLKAQNCVVDGCTFLNDRGSAIEAGPEFYWGEAPAIHNLTISNCSFTNGGSTAVDIDCFEGGKDCVSYDNQHIVIEGNTFKQSGAYDSKPTPDPNNWRDMEGMGALALRVHHCTDVVIRNNDFGDRARNAPDSVPLVRVDFSKNVTISDNKNLPDSEVKQVDVK